LKIRVKLSGRSTVTAENFTKCQKKRIEDIVQRNWSDSKEFGVEVPKKGKIHYFGPLLRDFWDFQRRKRVPKWKIWKKKKLFTRHFMYPSSQKNSV